MRAHTSLGYVVVMGGSVAGLLTALALSDRAEQVTVLERDRYGDGPGLRPGVPQSRHTHVLLAGGIEALDALLPGLLPELRAAGAPFLSVPGDLGVWQADGWISRRNPSAPVMTPSRPFLEHRIRERVLAVPRIAVRTGTEVTGLLGSAGRVTGVALRERGGGNGDGAGGAGDGGAGGTGTGGDGRRAEEELPAGLVVDATGRGSRTPAWLAAIGAPAPAEDVLDTGRAYATATFTGEAPPERIKGFYLVPDPGQPLGTIVLPAEDDRWMVTVSGPRDDPPPTDPEGFVDFASRLPHPAPHKWLSSAEPLTRPVGYRHTMNRRRRYERLGSGFGGLLVVGDAVCALNPVYGQGVSVAAMNAVALTRALADGRTPSVRALQRAVLRSSGFAWEVATGADNGMPSATGNALRGGPAIRLLTRYLDRLRAHVASDPVVCAANRDVLFLQAPPHTLVSSPRVLGRVLLRSPVPTPRDLPTP